MQHVHAVDCVTSMSRASWCEDIPFLWLLIRYMATNHLRSSTFVFSKIVPTRQEKFFPHCLQRNLLSFLSRQWYPPQYGHTMSPSAHLLSMIACLHFSSELKYIVSEMRLSNLLKSIMPVYA